MKRMAIIGLLLTLALAGFSQMNTKDISVELRYPVPMGNNFISKGLGEGYLGLMGAEIGYNALKYEGLEVGIMLHASVFSLDETDLKLTIIGPKFKLGYEIDINKISIVPHISAGYSNWRFRATEINLTDEIGNLVQVANPNKNYHGLSLAGGSKLVFNTESNIQWYINLTYEFTKLEKPEAPVEDNAYNRNIFMLYPGVGVTWTFVK